MKTLEDLLKFLETERDAAKQFKRNGETTQSRIYADGKETAYCIVIGEVRTMLAKNLPQAVVTPALPRQKPSRCCGRCDGRSDVCVSESICNEHNKEGCEVCWPHPDTPETCICVRWYGENKECPFCHPGGNAG